MLKQVEGHTCILHHINSFFYHVNSQNNQTYPKFIKFTEYYLNCSVRAKMQNFKNNVEEQFCTSNPKQAWERLNKMMARDPKTQVDTNMDLPFLNELNNFYGRFDSSDSKDKRIAVCTDTPQTTTIQLSEEEVKQCLSKINPHKAPGPKNLMTSARLP